MQCISSSFFLLINKMGINLSGSDIGMSYQRLDCIDVNTIFQQ